ncbi:MAG: helix-turn-helix protein [Thermomicrobiales bacterium]|jgi:cytoskeleton protein RodZ|nr:helix-turn-helix protein [Thermomicrobiales bacterium]MDF3038887.1 helix-turn-helix protein [Thermomicrobiales bacterium]
MGAGVEDPRPRVRRGEGSRIVAMGVFGDTLRQARVSKGVTLREAEQATRINRHHLAALEDEDFAVLPPLIYQRGIVRNYSAYLELDPGKSLAMFDEARGGEAASDLVAAVRPLDMPRHWSPNFAIIAFMVVMGAVIFAWVYSISFSQEPVASTVPPAIPTVTPIPDDRLALPSPTPVPTATPPSVATATAVPPSPTEATAPLAATTAPQAPVPAAQAPQVAPTVPVAAPQPPAGTATIRVIAEGDIQVTVTADGATVFSGWLGAGGATDWYTAAQFAVTTTDGSLTLFENAATGEQFYMGFEPNATYYLGG